MNSENIPIILDTDIGSNIDDALALSYLLNQPRCELLGITTVSGEAEKRASIADAVCISNGRPDVPINVGFSEPTSGKQLQPIAPHFSALEKKWPHRTFTGEVTALSFLMDTINSRPNEIVLLTIGPLTNIASLVASDPTILTRLRGIVSMAGRYFSDSAEWNFRCDPEAADIVLRSDKCPITLVGLDVTLQCSMSMDECLTRFKSIGGPLEIVDSLSDIWFRAKRLINFHDPLAAASIFDPKLISTMLGTAVMRLRDAELDGGIIFTPSPDGPLQAAASVDAEAFFTHYFDLFELNSIAK